MNQLGDAIKKSRFYLSKKRLLQNVRQFSHALCNGCCELIKDFASNELLDSVGSSSCCYPSVQVQGVSVLL